MKNKKGFTLAEVLITLAIIGVVAALTIPTLVTNTTSKQFQTQFKKSISVLCQAVMMNIAMDNTDFASLEAEDNDEHMEDCDSTKHMINIIKQRLQSPTKFQYSEITADSLEIGKASDSPLQNVNTSELFDTTTTNPVAYLFRSPAFADGVQTPSTSSVKLNAFILADGSVFAYNKLASQCKTIADKDTCIGYIDVNGNSGPNKEITCSNGELKGKTMNNGDTKCEVDIAETTDIYPVYFYGQAVVPASDAAKYILTNK